MKREITDFHKDSQEHWVADLECGHAQHMRHDPPWMEREWVLTKEGRDTRIGTELNCVRCDEIVKVLTKAHEQAGISGLCPEGRWEAALGALTTLGRNLPKP